MELQPQPSPFPKPPKPLLPFPQQQQRRRRIMIQLHPPLSVEHPPPQPVAVKSLMKTSILSESIDRELYLQFHTMYLCLDSFRIFSEIWDITAPAAYYNINSNHWRSRIHNNIRKLSLHNDLPGIIPGDRLEAVWDTFIMEQKKEKNQCRQDVKWNMEAKSGKRMIWSSRRIRFMRLTGSARHAVRKLWKDDGDRAMRKGRRPPGRVASQLGSGQGKSARIKWMMCF